MVCSSHQSESCGKYRDAEEKQAVLLNSRQVATLLELSPDTVDELARKNILPGVKRGRMWWFRQPDISLFKKQQQK